ncbi:DUF3038 domain-containing protein [Spirulina subsalsa FACHB-351]|uniref:DUF3038 domain-containing protein n=1 Tax=Spirulina subsalsa FACHB-351 TaxID=234711 RepID=A0ABT3LD90_9CYAN|nr:DUF3038 domain-containing protein [Spirulina subsalsa]MCW6038950.1 DUF3038 domain-containing protein [Spirulina subsalsa FACHB-351]
MSQSVNIQSDYSPPARPTPLILDSLPNPAHIEGCSLRVQQNLDLILLALEALELGGSEYMLATAADLELQGIIENRVVLWRLRCTNPWRKSYTRESLNLTQAKALSVIASYRARQLTVLIRQLLLAQQQIVEKGLPLEQHFRLSEYLERFRAHFRSRMNPKRAKVAFYLSHEEELNELALSLLSKLLFCTGTSGMTRLWISLFDGEVR